MNKFNVIIFDFDGVIAESVTIKTEAFADLYEKYGHDVVKKVVLHHEANGGISRFEKFGIYHKTFLGIELKEKEVKVLADKFSELVMQKVIASPFVKGAYEFLSENYCRYDFYISTGTPKEEIDYILREKGLTPFFKEAYGSPAKKRDHVLEIIQKHGYKTAEVVFVGDAPSDLEAARNNRISFIARVSNDSYQLDSPVTIVDLTELNEALNKC